MLTTNFKRPTFSHEINNPVLNERPAGRTERRGRRENGTEKREKRENGTEKREKRERGTERRGKRERGTERNEVEERADGRNEPVKLYDVSVPVDVDTNIRCLVSDGLKIERLRYNLCYLILNSFPKRWLYEGLVEINEDLYKLVGVRCLVDYELIGRKAKLFIDTYENLRTVVSTIKSLCKTHHSLNCDVTDCVNSTLLKIEKENTKNNVIILTVPSVLTSAEILDFYDNKNILLSKCAKCTIKNIASNSGKSKYRIEFFYLDQLGEVLLNNIVPPRTIRMNLDGEMRFFIKKWDVLKEMISFTDIKIYIKNNLRWTTGQNYPFICVYEDKQLIGLRNGNYKYIVAAKKLLDRLVKPLVITLEKSVLHFIKPSEDEIKDSWSSSAHFIDINYSEGKINIYGREDFKQKICKIIMAYFDVPELQYKNITIPIDDSSKRTILSNINEINELGCIVTILDKNIVVDGPTFYVDKTYDYILKIMTEIGEKIIPSESDKLCCFCFGYVSIEKCLSKCGCFYCQECFRQMIKGFTLSTYDVANCFGCNQTIAHGDITNSFSPSEFAELIKSSMNKYIAKNLDTYKFCPGADCNNIMYNDGSSLWRCNSCYITYCKVCELDYYNDGKTNIFQHDGKTCKEISISRQSISNDDLLWIMNNTKPCPSCGIRIEKNQGCLHMTCKQCGTHFCWPCGFSRAESNCTSFVCMKTGVKYAI